MLRSRLSERCQKYSRFIKSYKDKGSYPYFRIIESTSGTEVEVAGRRLLMASSNDYLGLTQDPYVIDKTVEIIKKYGTGTGGSRLLCGNLIVHNELEKRLALFVGKERALVFPTGFTTNLGAVASMLTSEDTILFDRENHASIYDACMMTKARMIPFRHNDVDDAALKLEKANVSEESGIIFLITEGVFSMSGTIVSLPRFTELKTKYHNLYIYLDDAHGLGTLGDQGRGVAQHYGLTAEVDFIMGTFSKTFGAIGGFIACDDIDIAEYLKHKARTMIFSAALPPGNIATVLACLDVLENQPQNLARLRRNIERVKKGYREIGIPVDDTLSPIIPVPIGDEDLAIHVSFELFEDGVFALPVVYPAVGRNRAIIRTTFMSTHSDAQIEIFLEKLERVLRKHREVCC